jgi:hypothetical protein
LTARGEPIDNAGDVYRAADKFVAASPLSSNGFAEVVDVGIVPSSSKIPILLLFD